MGQHFPFLFPVATILFISAAIGVAGQVNVVENITPSYISTNEVIRNSGAETIPNWFRIQKHQLASDLSREHCEQIAEENGAFSSLIGTGRSSSSSSSLTGTHLISISKDDLVSLIGTGRNSMSSSSSRIGTGANNVISTSNAQIGLNRRNSMSS
ncbi:hypothetical protein BVRB_6g147890 [Beta vulgaris subsp. vulgaris]|nr:hypothetical protein BVRB_6g147890 [Beta vulgaris subsp. vulgaris]